MLINSVHQYCFRYPPDYDLFYPNESEMMLVKRFVLNTSEPRVSINVQPAGDLTLEQAADRIVGVYAIPGAEVIRQPLTIDREAAILLDGLSGQDLNRQVVILHNGRLYDLYFLRMNKNRPSCTPKRKRCTTRLLGPSTSVRTPTCVSIARSHQTQYRKFPPVP